MSNLIQFESDDEIRRRRWERQMRLARSTSRYRTTKQQIDWALWKTFAGLVVLMLIALWVSGR